MEGAGLSASTGPPALHGRARSVIGALCLLWATAALVLQVLAWRDQRQYMARPKAPAETWRLGNLGAARLARCLRAVGERVPPESVTAVSAPGRDDEVFLFSWAAYLLPERRLVLRADTPAGSEVDFLFALGRAPADASLSPVLDTPCGTLYAVRPALGGASR